MNVVVTKFGGLGNRLFQYAAKKYYAEQYGTAMRIVVDSAWNALSNGYPRPWLLSHSRLPLRSRSAQFFDMGSYAGTSRATLSLSGSDTIL
jgi:hypothetical protein